MTEITLYQLKLTVINGEVDNLTELCKKLDADSIVLKQIEIDFINDNLNYKDEFYKAKINFMKNLYLYNWLILKKYFEDAIFREFELIPDYQKEDMKKHGWMFPQQMINIKIQTSGYTNETTEDLYIRYFNYYFDTLFGFNIGDKNSRIDRYYKQAIANYKNENYYSCATSLFPIIESYHQYINDYNKDKFYKIKDNLEGVSDKIKEIKQVFVTKIHYYEKLVDQFNELANNHYFKKNCKRKEEPEIINRNRLMHGLFTREVSQKDCLQLFCVISNMVVIKNILTANDEMNKISQEIEKINNIISRA